MKYTLLKRKKSTFAKNNTEFVTWMRKNDLQHFNDNSEFMQNYSHRKLTFEKIELRYNDEDNFVEDLVANELLSIDEKSKLRKFIFF